MKFFDWREIPFQSQRYDSLTDQLKELVHIANRFGMYDAADHLEYTLKQFGISIEN